MRWPSKVPSKLNYPTVLFLCALLLIQSSSVGNHYLFLIVFETVPDFFHSHLCVYFIFILYFYRCHINSLDMNSVIQTSTKIITSHYICTPAAFSYSKRPKYLTKQFMGEKSKCIFEGLKLFINSFDSVAYRGMERAREGPWGQLGASPRLQASWRPRVGQRQRPWWQWERPRIRQRKGFWSRWSFQASQVWLLCVIKK